MENNRDQFLSFGKSFLDKSGVILREKFKKNFNIESKDDGTFVTEIDKEIESLFLEKLQETFPDHGVIGEEFGSYNSESSYVWVIDPLDGTHSFIAGKPLFGTLLCLIVNKVPTLGFLDMPILNERWTGGKGMGVKKDNVNCIIKEENKDLKDCILSSTSLLMFDKNHENVIKKIYKKVKFPVFGTDCYAYGLLMSGKIDLIIEANMKPWDYMAHVPLIEEVGGLITDWSGKSLNIHSDGKVIASKSKLSYHQAMKYLKEIG